ncbi:MAG: hypothetical protein PHI59_07615, partial [Candidatus Omnitrophica bacterium]|nr:hypothetical protein [Candidatus Omnitrophota bacterium]
TEEVEATVAECAIYRIAIWYNPYIRNRIETLLNNRFGLNGIVTDEILDVAARNIPSASLGEDVADFVAGHYTEYSSLHYPFIHPAYVAHDMAVCNVVNPTHEAGKVALYSGSGADILNCLLSTDTTEMYFVDEKEVNPVTLANVLEYQWDALDITTYTRYAGNRGYDLYETLNNIEIRIITKLKSMGLKKEDIVVEITPLGSAKIRFMWTYPGSGEMKEYCVTFIEADITEPEQYPSELNAILDRGIDIYYQRAGMTIVNAYSLFMPRIGSALKVGGYTITDDHSLLNIVRSPEEYLEKDGPYFTKDEELCSPAMEEWRDVIYPVLNGTHYGWDVTIRQKLWDESEPASLIQFIEDELAKSEPNSTRIGDAIAGLDGIGFSGDTLMGGGVYYISQNTMDAICSVLDIRHEPEWRTGRKGFSVGSGLILLARGTDLTVFSEEYDHIDFDFTFTRDYDTASLTWTNQYSNIKASIEYLESHTTDIIQVGQPVLMALKNIFNMYPDVNDMNDLTIRQKANILKEVRGNLARLEMIDNSDGAYTFGPGEDEMLSALIECLELDVWVDIVNPGSDPVTYSFEGLFSAIGPFQALREEVYASYELNVTPEILDALTDGNSLRVKKIPDSTVGVGIYNTEGELIKICVYEKYIKGFENKNIAFMDSSKHDAVYYWIESKVDSGEWVSDYTLINFDFHNDAPTEPMDLDAATWVTYSKEGFDREPLIGQYCWVHDAASYCAVTSPYVDNEITDPSQLPASDKPVIVTIDLDYLISESYSADELTEDRIRARVRGIVNSLIDKGYEIKGINITRSRRGYIKQDLEQLALTILSEELFRLLGLPETGMRLRTVVSYPDGNYVDMDNAGNVIINSGE